MKSFRRAVAMLALSMLALGMASTAAYGDGGALLMQKDAGPFTITLFAAPQPLTAGVAELSVMVQERSSGQVLLDPVTEASAAPEGGGAEQQTVRLATGNSGNRLLQTGRVTLPRPGRWRLNVRVRRGSDVVQVSTVCAVQSDTSRAAIVWFYVLLPVTMILLFLLHQFLRQSQRERRR